MPTPRSSSSPGASRSRITRTTPSAAARSTPCTTQMETRFARVADIAQANLRRVAAALATRVAAPETGFGRGAGARRAWNPHASGMGEAEGELELGLGARRLAAPPARRRGPAGIPAVAELVDPGEVAASYTMAATRRGDPRARGSARVHGPVRVRARAGAAASAAAGSRSRWAPRSRAASTSRPRKAELLAWLAEAGEAAVTFRALRLPRFGFVSWIDCPAAACASTGSRADRRVQRPRCAPSGCPAAARRSRTSGCASRRAATGGCACIDRESGVVVEDALRLVSEGDRGDEYNFDPVPGGERVEAPARARVKLGPVSEAEVSLAIDARYRVPAALAAGPRRSRSARGSGCPCACGSGSRAGCPGSRSRSNWTTRRGITGCARTCALPSRRRASRWSRPSRSRRRPIAPEPASFGSEHPSEFPIGATPQRGFATLADGSRALTVANRGCAEVEAVREADGSTLAGAHAAARRRLAVARRPGAAQDPRRPGARDARRPGPGPAPRGIRLLAARGRRPAARAPMPIASAPRPGCSRPRADADAPLRDGARLLEIDDPAVVVSAIEPRAESTPLIRLYNASGAARRVALRWRGPGARRLEPVDLAGGAIRLEGFVPGEGASATPRAAPLADRESHRRLSRPGARDLRPCDRFAQALRRGCWLAFARCARAAHELRMQQPGQRRAAVRLPAPIRRSPRGRPSRGSRGR